MRLEEEENKRFKDYIDQKVWSIKKKSKNALHYKKKESINIWKVGMSVRSTSSSSINSSDVTLRVE